MKDKLYKNVLNIFSLIMAVVYISLGLFIFFKSELLNLSQFQKTGLGVLLFVYGLFRLYQIKRKRDQDIQEKDEE